MLRKKTPTNLHFFLIHDLFMLTIEIKVIWFDIHCTVTSIRLHGQA